MYRDLIGPVQSKNGFESNRNRRGCKKRVMNLPPKARLNYPYNDKFSLPTTIQRKDIYVYIFKTPTKS